MKAPELTIDVSFWRLFAAFEFVFAIASAPTLFFLPNPPLIIVVVLLFFFLVASLVGPAIGALMFSYALSFQIIDRKLRRQGLAIAVEVNIDAVVDLLDLAVFVRASTGPFTGTSLPGKILLDAEIKAALADYARQFLSKDHPLYNYWAGPITDAS